MPTIALGYAFARSSFLIMLAHRLRYVLGVFNYFIYVSVAWYLWEAVFYDQEQVATWSLPQMQTYVCVNLIFRSTYFSNADNVLASKISKGEIASDLLRPSSLVLQFYGSALGEMLFRAIFMGLPVGLVVGVSFGLLPPDSVAAALYASLSFLMAFHILFAINFLTGLCAVFTEKLQGFLWAKFILLQFLSGQLLPFEFFDHYPVLRGVFEVLPFKHISYTPVSIYLGRWETAKVMGELQLQLAWTVGLLIFCELGWRAVRRRLSLLGG